jgi:hypothetical protein
LRLLLRGDGANAWTSVQQARLQILWLTLDFAPLYRLLLLQIGYDCMKNSIQAKKPMFKGTCGLLSARSYGDWSSTKAAKQSPEINSWAS